MAHRILWVRAQYLEEGDRVYDEHNVLRTVKSVTPVTPITRPVYIDLALNGVMKREHVANLYPLDLTATYGKKIPVPRT